MRRYIIDAIVWGILASVLCFYQASTEMQYPYDILKRYGDKIRRLMP